MRQGLLPLPMKTYESSRAEQCQQALYGLPGRFWWRLRHCRWMTIAARSSSLQEAGQQAQRMAR
jgi:hypothetical protein